MASVNSSTLSARGRPTGRSRSRRSPAKEVLRLQIGIGYQEYFSLFIDMVETTDHFLQKKNYFCKASYVAINF